MKIIRQTPAELVVQDSSLWISLICALAATFLLYFVVAQHQTRVWYAIAFFLLCALVWLRRSTFTFSAATQRIDWNRLRFFTTKTGTIAFSDVRSINIESSSSDKGTLTYRLAIATISQGIVPMSGVYTSGQRHIESLRDTVQQFVKPADSGATPAAFSTASASIPLNADAARTAALNDSIRGLLQQGRKVDAILLVRQSEHLDLTEATFRVNHIESQLRSERVGQ